MAAGALTALKDNGIAIPLHLSVIGFDDIPIARYTTSSVDYRALSIASMAKIATELALQGLQVRWISRRRTAMPTTVRRHSVAWRQNAVLITN